MSDLGTLRPVAATDRDPLAELERRAFDQPWSATALGDELAKATCRGWLLAQPAGPTAYALFQAVAGEAELLRIAVDPGQRRQGLARHLLGQALAQLAEQGITGCHLEVRADNHPAQTLYHQLGFHPTGRRPAYYHDGSDALLFAIELGSEPLTA